MYFLERPLKEALAFKGRNSKLYLRVMVFNATLNNIVAVSFIGEGNWGTRRKLPTCRKSLKTLSHNVVSSTLAVSVTRTTIRS